MKQFITLIIILMLTSVAFSQKEDVGEINGMITDAATKEPLIGATILIKGTTLGAATNLEGKYSIRQIPEATYAVQISMVGYQSVVIPDVVVSSVKPVTINYSLTISPIEMQGVTVKPSFFEQAPDKPMSTQRQSYAEIRRLPGGLEDVVRAVSILPGVAQVQNGRNDLIVRGGAPSENLYVVDGIEVQNINHFGTQGATGGPLSYINIDFVESTTFSSGGFGARYGDKLSSVMQIDLRDGRTDRWGGKATVSATQFGASLEGPLAEKGSVILSARRSYLDFIFKSAGFAFVPEYWDFMIKSSYDLNEHNRFSFIGLSAINNVKLFNDTPEKRYDNSRILASDQYQALSGASWRRLLHKGFSTVTLAQTYFRFDQAQADTLNRPTFTNQSQEKETGLTANLLWRLGATLEASIGMQVKQIRFNDNLYLPFLTTDYGNAVTSRSDTQAITYKTAAWIQIEQRLHRFTLIAGSRFDHFDWIKQSVFSPRLSMRFDFSNLTRLNASVGSYHQAPSYIWLAANPVNTKLKYISVNQYILGMEHLLRDDFKVSLEGYYKRYGDYPASLSQSYLVMANTGAGYDSGEDGFASYGVDPLVSAGSGYARGIELFLQKRTSNNPQYGLLSVSYNQSQFKALDGVSRPSSYDQRWIVNFGGGYIFNRKWEVSGKFRFATGRPYTPYNPDMTRSPQLYNSKRIQVNHSLDLRADRRWSLSGWHLITYVDIQNVYNRPYYDVPRYNAFKNRMEQRSSIGLLPSIGISAEF